MRKAVPPPGEGDTAPTSSDLVRHLQTLLPNQQKETVMAVLGISSKTWTKLKRGEPVRPSVVARLQTRMGLTG